MSHRVPRLLRLAARLLPADIREEVLGDLLEHWQVHVSQRPRMVHLLWLSRQPGVAAMSCVPSVGADAGVRV